MKSILMKSILMKSILMKSILMMSFLLLLGCGGQTNQQIVPPIPEPMSTSETFYLYENQSMLDDFLSVQRCLLDAELNQYAPDPAVLLTISETVSCQAETGIVCGEGTETDLTAYTLKAEHGVVRREGGLHEAYVHLILGSPQGDETGRQCY